MLIGSLSQAAAAECPADAGAQQYATGPLHVGCVRPALVCNERYVSMYGMSPEVVRPGHDAAANPDASHRDRKFQRRCRRMYIANIKKRVANRARAVPTTSSVRRPRHRRDRTADAGRKLGGDAIRTSPSSRSSKSNARTHAAEDQRRTLIESAITSFRQQHGKRAAHGERKRRRR